MAAADDPPFVLDRVENPHPRMLAAALQLRAAAAGTYDGRPTTEARTAVRAEWRGYLRAMADATGCSPADLEAWLDRHAHAVPGDSERP